RVGAVAKLFLARPELLFMFEGQFMNQLIQPRGAPKQIIASLIASKFLGTAFMIDLGLGFFDENIQVTQLHREAVDLNLHWFMTSHIELMLTSRFEMLAFGKGGPDSGYALA